MGLVVRLRDVAARQQCRRLGRGPADSQVRLDVRELDNVDAAGGQHQAGHPPCPALTLGQARPVLRGLRLRLGDGGDPARLGSPEPLRPCGLRRLPFGRLPASADCRACASVSACRSACTRAASARASASAVTASASAVTASASAVTASASAAAVPVSAVTRWRAAATRPAARLRNRHAPERRGGVGGLIS
ncbi:hypothetical protein ACWDG1_30350 [Streptomyces sp. NPDC001177]